MRQQLSLEDSQDTSTTARSFSVTCDVGVNTDAFGASSNPFPFDVDTYDKHFRRSVGIGHIDDGGSGKVDIDVAKAVVELHTVERRLNQIEDEGLRPNYHLHHQQSFLTALEESTHYRTLKSQENNCRV